MIAAVAACRDGEVAPALDFAPEVRLYDVPTGGPARRLGTLRPPDRGVDALLTGTLRERGVRAVVCGGISRPLLWMLSESGITVYPGVSGPVEDALEGLSSGKLRRMTPGGWRGRGRRAGRGRGRGGGRRGGRNGRGPRR